ncbi:MAG: hypothetical protein Q8Q48_00135 [Candidatus Staskawiczbacteria bacterium]|nr:hypothetical protein [Candidatus Staskawiczbacteria bacterium]
MMADTVLGNFEGIACDDCGGPEVIYRHWGPLVPGDRVSHFCGHCFEERRKFFQEHGKPKAMGNANPLV